MGSDSALNHAGEYGQGTAQRIALHHPLASRRTQPLAQLGISRQLPKRREPLLRCLCQQAASRRHRLNIGPHAGGHHRDAAGHALDQLVGAFAAGPGGIGERHHAHIKLLDQGHFLLQAPGLRDHLHTGNGRGTTAHHQQPHGT